MCDRFLLDLIDSKEIEEIIRKIEAKDQDIKNKKQLYNFWDGKLVKYQPDIIGSWHAYDV
jgi:hypothetical protein